MTPVSKNPPTKPASMMMGCANSADSRPCSPTRAVSVSWAAGTLGISADQARPTTFKPFTTHSVTGLWVPSQTSKAGPMMKVALTMV